MCKCASLRLDLHQARLATCDLEDAVVGGELVAEDVRHHKLVPISAVLERGVGHEVVCVFGHVVPNGDRGLSDQVVFVGTRRRERGHLVSCLQAPKLARRRAVGVDPTPQAALGIASVAVLVRELVDKQELGVLVDCPHGGRVDHAVGGPGGTRW